MLRSLINSARGRSALANLAAGSHTSFILHEFVTARVAAREAEAAGFAEARAAVSSATERPARCCVYCGHAIYAPPRTPQVRCPKCFQHLPIKDITLTGEVTAERIVTAGKITVAAGARVAAELVACRVDVAGEVAGNILASHGCVLRETARHIGMLLTRHLDIQAGARLESEIEIIVD